MFFYLDLSKHLLWVWSRGMKCMESDGHRDAIKLIMNEAFADNLFEDQDHQTIWEVEIFCQFAPASQ